MIDPQHYRIDMYWPEGKPSTGGMSVGYGTDGVTVTHLPTGTTASVAANSQHLSRNIAMEMVEWALTYEARLRSLTQKERDDGES